MSAIASKEKTLAKIKSKDQLANEMAAEKLVPEINAHYWDLVNAGKEVANNAIAIGNLLLKLKKYVLHGEWDKFIEDRCDFSARSASQYMKIAKELPEAIKSAGQESSEILTLRGACKLISEVRTPRKAVQKRSALPISPPNQVVDEKQPEPATPQAPAPAPASNGQPTEACIHQYDEDGVCMKCQKDFVPKVTEKDKPRILKDIQNGLAALKVVIRGVGALARLADQGAWKKVVERDLNELQQQYAAFMGPFV